MKKPILIAICIFFAGCSSSRYMEYQPSTRNISESKAIIESLTYSQHELWKPDNFAVTDEYMIWDFRIVTNSETNSQTKSVGLTKQFGNSGLGLGLGVSNNNSETTGIIREAGDRAYFRLILEAKLIDWKRKGRQWYVVRLINSDRSKKNVLRTRSLDDAKMYIDAITTLADNSKNIHEKTNTYAQDNSEIEETKMKENMYSELIKLDDLREKGILTEKEFNQQKQKILNAN